MVKMHVHPDDDGEEYYCGGICLFQYCGEDRFHHHHHHHPPHHHQFTVCSISTSSTSISSIIECFPERQIFVNATRREHVTYTIRWKRKWVFSENRGHFEGTTTVSQFPQRMKTTIGFSDGSVGFPNGSHARNSCCCCQSLLLALIQGCQWLTLHLSVVRPVPCRGPIQYARHVSSWRWT